MNMGDKIFRIVVPEEDEIEIKGGKKQVFKRRIFPGYVLVEMILTDESWYVVRNTPGVTGFVGSGNKPLPLADAEAEEILKRMEGKLPRVRIDLAPGEKVRVTSGPFQNFIGVVEEVSSEKAKLRVLISMFGREVPIELDYSQIEKIV